LGSGLIVQIGQRLVGSRHLDYIGRNTLIFAPDDGLVFGHDSAVSTASPRA
jgi:hypothetical protein